MNTYQGVDIQIHIFLTLALVGASQLHAPAALPQVPIAQEAGWDPELA
jgi:hypothetical protein